jgi:hypothetical protein
MRFVVAEDPEAMSLRADLADRAMDTDASGLRTANAWLWVVQQPDTDPRAVVADLLAHPTFPCRHLLEPHAVSGPWLALNPAVARDLAVKLLTSGASMEMPAFDGEPRAAEEFAGRLLGWVGHPLAALASMDHRSDGSAAGFGVFRVPHWVDEGLVLVGPGRIGMLWFVGTD